MMRQQHHNSFLEKSPTRLTLSKRLHTFVSQPQVAYLGRQFIFRNPLVENGRIASKEGMQSFSLHYDPGSDTLLGGGRRRVPRYPAG